MYIFTHITYILLTLKKLIQLTRKIADIKFQMIKKVKTYVTKKIT